MPQLLGVWRTPRRPRRVAWSGPWTPDFRWDSIRPNLLRSFGSSLEIPANRLSDPHVSPPFCLFIFFYFSFTWSLFCALSLISFPLFIFNFCVFFLRFLPPPPPPQFPVFYGTIRVEEGTKFQTSSMFFCSSAFIFMGVAPVGGGIVSIRSIASSSSGFRLAFIE